MSGMITGSKAGVMAYHSLKDLVTTYQFRPYEKLQIQALAEELGTSTTPVREALLRLLGEGLINCNPHRGFYVKPINVHEIRHFIDLHYHLMITALHRESSHSDRLDVNNAVEIGKHVDFEDQIRATDLLVVARSGNKPIHELVVSIKDRIRFVIRGEIATAEGYAMCMREVRAIRSHLDENQIEAVAEILTEQSRRRVRKVEDFAMQVTMRYMDTQVAKMPQEKFMLTPCIQSKKISPASM